MKISVISGGFDPLHSGHIAYINAAAALGDILIILLNSDEWLAQKKGKAFMPFSERKNILENLVSVNIVQSFEDDDLGSCSNGLKSLIKEFPNDEIIFCNGGDRGKNNIPEMEVAGITFAFSVGGDDKKNSSSWILKDYQYDTFKRIWGSFNNLFEDDFVKVKELIVNPNSGMSFQRHFLRSEIWLVSKGECIVNFAKDNPDDKKQRHLKRSDHFIVEKEEWHQITNPFEDPCHIIEIQYGENTVEDDIERLYFYENN